jgi:hypothetical protein
MEMPSQGLARLALWVPFPAWTGSHPSGSWLDSPSSPHPFEGSAFPQHHLQQKLHPPVLAASLLRPVGL